MGLIGGGELAEDLPDDGEAFEGGGEAAEGRWKFDLFDLRRSWRAKMVGVRVRGKEEGIEG